MANEELIRGRNLFSHPTFTGDWRTYWTATPGKHRVRQDTVTGLYYMELVDGGTATCTVPLPVSPHLAVRYLFAFLYQAIGSGDNNVSIRTDDGTEIFNERFRTRKVQSQSGSQEQAPLAALVPYDPYDLQGLKRGDTQLIVTLTAAGGGEDNGFYFTGFDMNAVLASLAASILLDGRPIPLPELAVS